MSEIKTAPSSEILKRLYEAKSLMRRMKKAMAKESWEDGESVEQVLEEMNEFVSGEELEDDLFRYAVVPVFDTRTHCIPDLTGIPHKCKKGIGEE